MRAVLHPKDSEFRCRYIYLAKEREKRETLHSRTYVVKPTNPGQYLDMQGGDELLTS